MYDWNRMLRGIDSLPVRDDKRPVNNCISKFPNFQILKFSLDLPSQTVIVAQLVRALDCGSRGRGFKPHQSPSFFI